MARRRQFSVEDVPLVGGALALDFVNTTGARASEVPRERLHSYADLVVWAYRTGILDRGAASAFRSTARGTPGPAADAFDRARTLREDGYEVLAPLATGAAPSRRSLLRIERWIARACGERRLDLRGGRPVWTWRVDPGRLDSLLWPIVGSVETVLATDLDLLKKCGECDWLFLDTSRKGSRRWCKKLCGDRVRARRHYARRSRTEPERS